MARSTTSNRTVAPTTISFANSLSFNGTSDYVNIPDNNAYSYATTSELTVSCWINPDTLSQPTTEGTGYVHFLSKLDSSQNEWTFRMYSAGNSESRNNRISFYVFALAGGLGDGAYFEDEVVPGEWINLVATVDGSKNISIYKNGVLRNVFLASALTLANGTAPIRIGRGYGSSDASFFKGKIQNVNIFNRVLSRSEILDLWNKDASITSGLVGKFNLNEGSGTTVIDGSSTANNGTLTGGTWVTGWTRKRQSILSKSPTNLNTFDTATNIRPARRSLLSGNSLALVSASSQYATIANASQVGLDFGTNDFMIGGWFYIKVGTAIQTLMAKYSGSGYALSNGTNVGFDLLYRGDLANKPLQFRVTDGTNSATCAMNTNVANLNGWNHIVIYGQRSNSAHFVINGVKVSTSSISNTNLTITNTGAFMIGTRVDATTGFMNGLVKNAFLYVFSGGLPYNIRQIVNNIYTSEIYSTTGLVSKWSFSSVATDSVGVNNLTLTGSPSYSTYVPSKVRLAA